MNLVLIPGLLCDGTVWRHQTVNLGRNHHVHVADVTGPSSLPDMARAVLETVPGPISVAGHSMGARVALEMVRIAPERIERLALLDTGAHPRQDGEVERRKVLVDLAFEHGMKALADRWLPPMVAPGALERNPALREALYAMVTGMTPEIHQRQIRALLDRPDAESLLPTLRCPVLIGVGDEDAWSPPEQHRRMAVQVPGSLLRLFKDSGHRAPREAPEAVTAALGEWLGLPARTHFEASL